MQQFTSRKQLVRRPVGARYEDRYNRPSHETPSKRHDLKAMSVLGTAGLYFFQPVTTINGAKYLNLFKDKLEILLMVHDCNVLMYDGAPCHRAKSVKNFLRRILIS